MKPIRAFTVSIILLVFLAPAVAEAQNYSAPRHWYSCKWQMQTSQLYGPKAVSHYYWKLPNQNAYRRYEVIYYYDAPEWIHLWNPYSGQFWKKCASPQHPNYHYWQNQWCNSTGPDDVILDPDFDPNPPQNPGNSDISLPRPPCPPEEQGGMNFSPMNPDDS